MTSSDSSDDRRREARLSPGDVECEIEGAKFVHVLGLSVEGHGMRVMTERPLPSGNRLPVRLEIATDTVLAFEAEVVWEKEENFEFTHRYISGLRFVDANPEATERLQHFIGDHQEQADSSSPAAASAPADASR